MPLSFQIVVDCHDPHALADWWAETLGWTVEEQDPDFIRRMIAEGYATDADTRNHNGNLVWREGAAIFTGEGAEPHSPGRRRMLFQAVPEAKTGKNRMHIDVFVGADQAEAMVERLQARGATFVHRASQGPHSWITLADPEGNEFCVT